MWVGGPGATWIRIFALLQTLFYTTGFMSVAVDLIAVQCFNDDPRLVCAALPQWIDGLETWSRIARSALLSIAPILLLALIYLDRPARPRRVRPGSARCGRRRGRREPAPSPMPCATRCGRRSRRPPLLAAKGFWRESRIAYTTERAHFAGVIALVLFLLAYDALVEAAATVPWPSASASATQLPRPGRSSPGSGSSPRSHHGRSGWTSSPRSCSWRPRRSSSSGG